MFRIVGPLTATQLDGGVCLIAALPYLTMSMAHTCITPTLAVIAKMLVDGGQGTARTKNPNPLAMSSNIDTATIVLQAYMIMTQESIFTAQMPTQSAKMLAVVGHDSARDRQARG